MNRLLIVAAAMVVVAGAGGVTAIGAAMAAKRPQGLDACISPAAQAGLRDAILTRIAARGGEVDAGYALSLDTPRLESVDYSADRTTCGGTARWAVPEHRRAALDGVSELSDPVRYMIEPGRDGGRMTVALVGGGDRIANWLGAPPPPPAPPPPEMLRADYVPDAPDPTTEPTVPQPLPGEVTPGMRSTLERLVVGLIAPPREAGTPAATPPSPTVRERPVVVARAPAAPATSVPPPPPPSATTRRLNADGSTTGRLNTPPARQVASNPTASPAVVADPRPVSARRVDQPVPPPSGGPSFDCRRSRNAAERAICGDDRLAQMDVALSRRYTEAQSGLGVSAAANLRAEQREWLHRRDACETQRCLEMMYETRAARLSRMN